MSDDTKNPPKSSKSLNSHPRDYYKQKQKEKAKLKAGKNGKKVLDAAFDDMDKNPEVKKSEWTNEPITLSKGSFQSRNKFDTRSPEVQQIASDQQKWTGSREDKATRGDLPRMEGAARVRALHKLHSKTQVRVNPSGEREFLMHRGVGNEERKNKNDDVNGKTNYTKFAVTSWSPHKHIAQRFAEYRSPNWQDPKDNIVSAWVPESSISHSVRQYNTHDASTYDGVKNKTIPKVGLKVGRDYNQRSEDEYIVDHSSGKHFDHHESMKRSDDAQKSERNNEPMSLAKTMTIGHAAGLENTKTGGAAIEAPLAEVHVTQKPFALKGNAQKLKAKMAKIQAEKELRDKNPKENWDKHLINKVEEIKKALDKIKLEKAELDESWFFLDEVNDLKKANPTREGELHPEYYSGKPWVAKIHPVKKQIMWHANDKQAAEIDGSINKSHLHKEAMKYLKEPHLSAYKGMMNQLIKDPHRHFIPCEEGGKDVVRARHIKSLLSAGNTIRSDISDKELVGHEGTPRLDTTDPNNLIIHRKSHSEGYNQHRIVSIKIPIKKV